MARKATETTCMRNEYILKNSVKMSPLFSLLWALGCPLSRFMLCRAEFKSVNKKRKDTKALHQFEIFNEMFQGALSCCGCWFNSHTQFLMA